MAKEINWYPGHMKKTRELVRESLKIVDAAVELLDARIPISSRNPVIDEILGMSEHKKRIILLNKSDLSDLSVNRLWVRDLAAEGGEVFLTDANSGKGIGALLDYLKNLENERNRTARVKRALRIMIIGIPNVGKSTLINQLAERRGAKTGDKPGVTRGKQWITLKNKMQLLDTPGILWPKFEDRNVGLNLAFCGAIKDDIMDIEDLSFELIKKLNVCAPAALAERYGISNASADLADPLSVMDAIALRRGFLLGGGRIDYERTARCILLEFRAGQLGRISLERPGER